MLGRRLLQLQTSRHQPFSLHHVRMKTLQILTSLFCLASSFLCFTADAVPLPPGEGISLDGVRTHLLGMQMELQRATSHREHMKRLCNTWVQISKPVPDGIQRSLANAIADVTSQMAAMRTYARDAAIHLQLQNETPGIPSSVDLLRYAQDHCPP